MHRTRPFLLALALLPAGLPAAALFPGPARAQIQRSVDSSGVISISGGRSKTSKSPSGSSDGPAIHMPSDTSSGRLSRYDEHIREAATLYRLPAAYIRAILQTESNYDPRAVSPA